MAFAFSYRALGALQHGPFFGTQGEGNISQDLFFSFTTLTTTGYGNPTTTAGDCGERPHAPRVTVPRAERTSVLM